MPIEKYNGDCAGGANPAERIRRRLDDSGGGNPGSTTVKTGDGPQRVFHHIHHSGNVKRRDGADGLPPSGPRR